MLQSMTFSRVRHPSATPILEALRSEQVHADHDIDGVHQLAPRDYLLHSARDSRIERIVTKPVDTHCRL